MDRAADLDSARSFVIARIAEQAKLSVEPLSDEQRLLLNHLPSSTPATWDPEILVLVPRNINLERVCALGKAAYQHDRQLQHRSIGSLHLLSSRSITTPWRVFCNGQA
jgi:hypothetical protein